MKQTHLFILFLYTFSSTSSNPTLEFAGRKSSKLGEPEPCEDEFGFCGEDESKYPSQDEIDAIINSNHEVQKWINETGFLVKDEEEEIEEEGSGVLTGETEEPLQPACSLKRKRLPNFGRFRNKLKKWKYVIQKPQLMKSGKTAEVIVCENAGKICINDNDSPYGAGATICRQSYRYQRLLAVDKDEKVSLDSFSLPSGCLCHHTEKEPYLLRKGLQGKFNSTKSPLLRSGLAQEIPSSKCSHDRESEILLVNSRIRREAEQIIFPDEMEDIVEVENFPRTVVMNKSYEVPPCPNGEDFCELLPSYPENVVNILVNRTNLRNELSPEDFNNFHSQPCQEKQPRIGLKIGTFDSDEKPLCESRTENIFPQKGKNVNGQWRHIINTKIYKQGVSIERCYQNIKGYPCLYDGIQGETPNATVCKQQYSLHPFVVFDAVTRERAVELFNIPTACVCHLVDITIFK